MPFIYVVMSSFNIGGMEKGIGWWTQFDRHVPQTMCEAHRFYWSSMFMPKYNLLACAHFVHALIHCLSCNDSYIYIYICIYIERERERMRWIYIENFLYSNNNNNNNNNMWYLYSALIS